MNCTVWQVVNVMKCWASGLCLYLSVLTVPRISDRPIQCRPIEQTTRLEIRTAAVSRRVGNAALFLGIAEIFFLKELHVKSITDRLFAMVFDDPDTAGEVGAALLRMGFVDYPAKKRTRHRPEKRTVTPAGKPVSRSHRAMPQQR